jgi:hypothetical protein
MITQAPRALAQRVGIDVAISLEGLDEYLQQRGGRRPPEVLSQLAMHNLWLAARIGQAPA